MVFINTKWHVLSILNEHVCCGVNLEWIFCYLAVCRELFKQSKLLHMFSQINGIRIVLSYLSYVLCNLKSISTLNRQNRRID